MKIVIDARMINWTGIGRYTRELLDHLQQIDHQNRYQVILLHDELDVWGAADADPWQPTVPNFEVIKIAALPYHPRQEQRPFASAIKQLKPDLVHFTSINRPAFYRGKNITTIHDLIMLDQSTSWRKFYKKVGLRVVARLAIRNTDQIIVPLNYTKKLLSERFPAATPKIKVIYEAAGDLPTATKPAGQFKAPFLLYVGNAYAHKNLPRLLGAFAQAKLGANLVLVGNMADQLPKLKTQAKALGVQSKVNFVGFVKDAQLAWYYQQALALVLPSLAEGFGLQALEAMRAQTPIVAADNGAYPEVCQKAAIYFDPKDSDDMAAKLHLIESDKPLRQQLIVYGGKRRQDFSWQKTARTTLDLYVKTMA